jgi:hypothetical protein
MAVHGLGLQVKTSWYHTLKMMSNLKNYFPLWILSVLVLCWLVEEWAFVGARYSKSLTKQEVP